MGSWVDERLAGIGQPIIAALEFLGEIVLLLLDALRRLLAPPFEFRELIQQMSFVGVASVPIVALTTFSSGAVISLYSADILVRYGAETLAGATVGLAVVREIAPVLAGIMVAARCGSAMAAQIGTMAVTEQIDALRSLNVSPIKYLVVPRVWACLLMLPVLGLIGAFSGVAGGYLVATTAGGVPGAVFTDSVKQFMEVGDLTKGLIKTMAFG
ncbi:MAG: ABC transporter permease, partial [Fimbriimonadaceae bacterium]|nr:ABC transporter permease [Fimbriimonadaceae bacterium]